MFCCQFLQAVFVIDFFFFHCIIHFVKSSDENYPKKKKPFPFLNRGKKWRKTGGKIKMAIVLNRRMFPLESVLLLFPQNSKKFIANCLIAVVLTNGNQTLL